jgi:adenine-specific DNA glycosylase
VLVLVSNFLLQKITTFSGHQIPNSFVANFKTIEKVAQIKTENFLTESEGMKFFLFKTDIVSSISKFETKH